MDTPLVAALLRLRKPPLKEIPVGLLAHITWHEVILVVAIYLSGVATGIAATRVAAMAVVRKRDRD